MGALGTLLGRSWAPLGSSWGALGHPWGALGALLGALGTRLGRSWARLGRLLDATWKSVEGDGALEAQLGAPNPAKLAQNPSKIDVQKNN